MEGIAALVKFRKRIALKGGIPATVALDGLGLLPSENREVPEESQTKTVKDKLGKLQGSSQSGKCSESSRPKFSELQTHPNLHSPIF